MLRLISRWLIRCATVWNIFVPVSTPVLVDAVKEGEDLNIYVMSDKLEAEHFTYLTKEQWSDT